MHSLERTTAATRRRAAMLTLLLLALIAMVAAVVTKLPTAAADIPSCFRTPLSEWTEVDFGHQHNVASVSLRYCKDEFGVDMKGTLFDGIDDDGRMAEMVIKLDGSEKRETTGNDSSKSFYIEFSQKHWDSFTICLASRARVGGWNSEPDCRSPEERGHSSDEPDKPVRLLTGPEWTIRCAGWDKQVFRHKDGVAEATIEYSRGPCDDQNFHVKGTLVDTSADDNREAFLTGDFLDTNAPAAKFEQQADKDRKKADFHAATGLRPAKLAICLQAKGGRGFNAFRHDSDRDCRTIDGLVLG